MTELYAGVTCPQQRYHKFSWSCSDPRRPDGALECGPPKLAQCWPNRLWSRWPVTDTKRVVPGLVLICTVSLVAAPVGRAQEAEGAHVEVGAQEEARHRHVVSLFAGVATHTERSETGGAIGLSYAYRVAPKWALGVKAEFVSSRLERDWLLLAALAFEAAEHLELVVGIGTEEANRREVEEGEAQQVTEIEAVVRLGMAYGFRLNDRMALLPEFNADIGGSRVTYVYGLALSLGL